MDKVEKISKIRKMYEEQLDGDSKRIFYTMSDLFAEDTFFNPIIVYGLTRNPDFGYFELGKRYWASSVCIYIVGAADGFSGDGVGYTEPWLFLARHAMELLLKSMNLYLIWLDALRQDRYQNFAVDISELLKQFNGRRHDLKDLYGMYTEKNREICQLYPVPDFVESGLNEMLLSTETEQILNGFHEIDSSSFRFRYPTEKISTGIEKFQEIGWSHAQDIETYTKIAMKSGTYFNHLDAFEKLSNLYQGLHDICNGFENSGILIQMEQQQELHQLYIKQLSGIQDDGQ
jgi:hypothetical protein